MGTTSEAAERPCATFILVAQRFTAAITISPSTPGFSRSLSAEEQEYASGFWVAQRFTAAI
jgi:hypothetical protein